MKRSRQAFTLLELLMVLAVITLLVGLLLPALRAVHRHARAVAAETEVRQLEGALHQYYAT